MNDDNKGSHGKWSKSELRASRYNKAMARLTERFERDMIEMGEEDSANIYVQTLSFCAKEMFRFMKLFGEMSGDESDVQAVQQWAHKAIVESEVIGTIPDMRKELESFVSGIAFAQDYKDQQES